MPDVTPDPPLGPKTMRPSTSRKRGAGRRAAGVWALCAAIGVAAGPAWVARSSASVPPTAAPAPGTPTSPAAAGDGGGATASHPGAWGLSLWGPIPAPVDSVRARLANRPLALWEKTLIYPYEVVKLPFRVLVDGVGATIIFLEKSRTISKVSRLLAPKEVPYGVLLSAHAGGSSGVGGGATFYHNALYGPTNRAQLRFETTTAGIRKLTLGAMTGAGTDNEFSLGTGYRKRPNTRYYGIGPEANESDVSYFTQELTWVGTGYRRALRGSRVFVLGEALFSAVGSRGPNEEHQDESIERVFADDLPPGHADRSDGITLSLTLEQDTAGTTGRPEGGAIRRLRAAWFESTDRDELSFWTYRAEVQEFIPLWYSQRALALRGLVGWIDPNGGVSIPFQRLMTNDDPDLLRGYQDFRWRDRGLLVATAEYRFPWWTLAETEGGGLDMYLLSDVGQVFGTATDIAMSNMTASLGVGLRLVGRSGFLTRAEVAFSHEGGVFRLRADQVFQFMRGGLYHGRDPIPSR